MNYHSQKERDEFKNQTFDSIFPPDEDDTEKKISLKHIITVNTRSSRSK